jgi:hypothetical protein
MISEYPEHVINADWYELARQSGHTGGDWMCMAADRIDLIFGDGYAVKHPELIAAYMQVAASDFHSAAIGMAAQKLCNHMPDLSILDHVAQRVTDAMRKRFWSE